MLKTNCNLLLLLLGCFTLSACNNSQNISGQSCKLSDIYPVNFIGAAFGEGNIQFKPLADGQNGVSFQIAIHSANQATNETPALSIKGVGQCLAGVVKGQFGSGSANDPDLKVLGGNFEGVFDHPNTKEPFGRWKIALHHSGKDKDYNLSGFWQRSQTNTQQTSQAM